MKYFDLHADTPTVCFEKDIDFDDASLMVSANHNACFEKYKQCFAIWINDSCKNPFKYYQAALADFKKKISAAFDKPDCFFTVENGKALEGDISLVEQLKEDNMKSLTLTWNGENDLASGAYSRGGLKPFGQEVIRALNHFGIATDLSHINREGFWQAIELADFPIASHSCCAAVHNHPRNLDDGQIKSIAQKNGLVGLCLYPVFLGGDDVFLSVYEHLCHMLDLGLEDNIAIGSDFDGAEMDIKLENACKIPSLYAWLSQNGIETRVLDKIFFKNADIFFSKL